MGSMKIIFQFFVVCIIVSSLNGQEVSCPNGKVFVWASHSNDLDGYYKEWDWTCIGSVGFFGDPEDSPLTGLIDYAHARGVKVVKGASMHAEDMLDKDLRYDWIQDQLNNAKEKNYDGVNIDYEGHNPKYTQALTSLTVETANTFHAELPGSEVSVDIPVYPTYEGRNYEYKELADASDYLFVMAYDAEGWLNAQCVAKVSEANCSQACAPIDVVEYGVQSYVDLGIDPKKLYLGLPWYGLAYEYVKKIPFLARQIGLNEVIDVMNRLALDPKKNASLTFDESSMTWRYDCDGLCEPEDLSDKKWYTEIWFDDHESLKPKYELAKKYNLLGVGMWHAAYLDYATPDSTKANKFSVKRNEQEETKLMWDALTQ